MTVPSLHGRSLKLHLQCAAAAAALILAGFGGWAALTAPASVAAPTGVGVDPMQMMLNAKDSPTGQYPDLSLVY